MPFPLDIILCYLIQHLSVYSYGFVDINQRIFIITGFISIFRHQKIETVKAGIVRMLERLGYEVAAVANGQEALDYYSDSGGSIDLVVIDMIMPVMGGDECFRQLRRMNPNVRVVLSTGYMMGAKSQATIAAGVTGFIEKPYSFERLSVVVAEALKR